MTGKGQGTLKALVKRKRKRTAQPSFWGMLSASLHIKRQTWQCIHSGTFIIVLSPFQRYLKYLLMMVERIIVSSTEERNWKVSKKKSYSFHNCHMLDTYKLIKQDKVSKFFFPEIIRQLSQEEGTVQGR